MVYFWAIKYNKNKCITWVPTKLFNWFTISRDCAVTTSSEKLDGTSSSGELDGTSTSGELDGTSASGDIGVASSKVLLNNLILTDDSLN